VSTSIPNAQLDEVAYTTEGSVVTIALDRPDKLNAISARPGGTRDQLIAALTMAENDPNIGCVVIRGRGRAFCGGGDLTGNARRTSIEQHRAFLAGAEAFHARLRSSSLPTIAAVHGHCLGAGLLLAEACDLVLASESATFGFPEGRLGLVGVTALIPVVGRQWAKFLMLTGESIDAHRAERLGLVLTVEPDDELFDRAHELAVRIARMPRESVLLNRRAIEGVDDAAGRSGARAAAIELDAETLDAADRAQAPDGRTFREILETEGMPGLKQAREAQYREPWLR
jgi:enoyl-CoA hydratase/carnithine racemase